MKPPTVDELGELMNLWHLSKRAGNNPPPEAIREARERAIEKRDGRVKIYNRVIQIYASKEGMPHNCDTDCRAHNHLYQHKFTKKACIYGLPNGTLIIV